MINLFYVILSIPIILCCKRKVSNDKLESSSNKNIILNTVNVKNKDIDEDEFLPVYQFSKNSYGIVLKLEESTDMKELYSAVVDSTINLYYDKVYNDYLKPADTTGNIPLFRNKLISKTFNHKLGEKYFLILNDKKVKTKVEDILFYTNECITSFVLLKLYYKLTKDEMPIFCIKKDINLTFNKNTKEENGINNYLKVEEQRGEFSVFAKDSSNRYLGYLDDFKRAKNKSDKYYSNLKVYFPTRIVFDTVGEKHNIVLKHNIDLFGEPCN